MTRNCTAQEMNCILEEVSPALYSHYADIIKPISIPGLFDESQIFCIDNKNEKGVIAYTRNYIRGEDIWWDVQLATTNVEHIESLIEMLPIEGKYFIALRDLVYIPFMEKKLKLAQLEKDGEYLTLHADKDTVTPFEYKEHIKVMRLTLEHDALVSGSESSEVRNIWQMYNSGDENVNPFGIIEHGKLVAFCSVYADNTTMATIQFIYTETDYRNRGYGKIALHEATNYIVNNFGRARYNVHADNLSSIAISKTIGYVEDFRDYFFIGAQLK